MMQKIVKFLEQYVQWGVLALGVAFFGYMCWTYLYNNPASGNYPGPPPVVVSPGTVDPVIRDAVGQVLEQKIHQTNSNVQIPLPPPPTFDLNGATTQPVIAEMAPVWDSWSVDIDKYIPPPPHGGGGGGPVDHLPNLPPLVYVDNETLRTVLNVPNAAGAAVHQDTDAVTTFWSLPVVDLAKAFRAAFAGLPPAQQQTEILRTELIRQKQLPDGSWGPEEPIALLNFATPPVPPYPVANNADQAAAYKTWVEVTDNQKWFVAPPFPALAYSDRPELQWLPLADWLPARALHEAQEAVPVTETSSAAPAPTTPVAAQPPPPVAPPVGPRGSGPGGGGGPRGLGGGGGGGGYGGGGGGRGGRGAAAQPPPPQTPPAPAPIINPFGPANTGQQPAAQPVALPQVAQPQVTIPKLQAPPDSPEAFVPSTLLQAGAGDVEIYLHDLTVEPGATYRYKARYTLLNPIFGAQNQPPNLTAQFDMVSPDSNWTPPITVPSRTRFWCAHQPLGLQAGLVMFNVYAWHDGIWQEKDFSAGVADEIGAAGSDVDYMTHWTMLDRDINLTNPNSPNRHVYVAPDPGGAAEDRSVLSDESSQDYKKFMRDFNAQKPLNGPAVVPGPTGGPTPPSPGG